MYLIFFFDYILAPPPPHHLTKLATIFLYIYLLTGYCSWRPPPPSPLSVLKIVKYCGVGRVGVGHWEALEVYNR